MSTLRPDRPDTAGRVHFHDLHPTPADMRAEVLAGLALPQKRLSPKYFYDDAGSRLFDAICELPEYYPTRTEIGILRRHGAAMAARLGRDVLLIELGSGSSLKIRTLLAALEPAIYMPVDISREHLLRSVHDLAAAFPELVIHAVCADYSSALVLPLDDPVSRPLDHWGHQRAAFFPGSSIGNFEPPDAARFLQRVGQVLGAGGRLLIGVDLVKDTRRLEAAYNDAEGVTAAFNLNLLARINRELDADFDLDAFRHDAFFNVEQGRIEMHLVSIRPQQVQVAGRSCDLIEGETIHTESSYKYRVDGFHALAAAAGFSAEQVWTDPDELFSLHCLVRD